MKTIKFHMMELLITSSNLKSNCELQTQFSQSYLYFFRFFFRGCRRNVEDAVITLELLIYTRDCLKISLKN